jgi:hypothetical protein
MSKSNAHETGWLTLVLENDDTDALISAIGSGLLKAVTPGSLYVALHTVTAATLGDTAVQNSNEPIYTNYARVAIARTTAKWTLGTGTASNVDPVIFPTCGATGDTVKSFSIGVAASGATAILYYGALTDDLVINNGITPSFAAGELTITED